MSVPYHQHFVLTGLNHVAVNTPADGYTWRWEADRLQFELAQLTLVDIASGLGNWKVFYSDGSGVITALSLGAANTLLQSNGASSAPTFSADLVITSLDVAGGDHVLNGTSVVFNENSDDIDFRIESNGNANMFTVDAGLDAISIGVAANTAIQVAQGGSFSGSSVVIGYRLASVLTPTDTNNVVGFQASFTAGSSTENIGEVQGMRIAAITKGNSGTITTLKGLLVNAQTATSTNVYGVYIEAPTGGSSVNTGLHNLGTTVLVGQAETQALLLTRASVTGGASLRVPHGTAPSSPTNGDIWTTTTAQYNRINGVTEEVLYV